MKTDLLDTYLKQLFPNMNKAKTFRLFKIKGTQYIVLPNCTGVSILDDAGNNYGAWQCETRFKAAVKRGAHKTVAGTEIPAASAIGRAYPQIAHGEIRIALPVA
jgi:hypothetical protein